MLLVPSIPVIYNRHHTTTGGGPSSYFSDSFTGADGSAPAGAWVDRNTNYWQIQSNRLENRGAGYGLIKRATGIGNQTFTFDQDFGNAGATFAIYMMRVVDFSNYIYYQLNGSDILTMGRVVAGVDSGVLQTDSTTRCGSGAGPCSVSIQVSGNSFTLVVTGGAQTPGTFGPFTDSTFAASGAGVGFGMNTGKSGCYFDNAAVSNP